MVCYGSGKDEKVPSEKGKQVRGSTTSATRLFGPSLREKKKGKQNETFLKHGRTCAIWKFNVLFMYIYYGMGRMTGPECDEQ